MARCDGEAGQICGSASVFDAVWPAPELVRLETSTLEVRAAACRPRLARIGPRRRCCSLHSLRAEPRWRPAARAEAATAGLRARLARRDGVAPRRPHPPPARAAAGARPPADRGCRTPHRLSSPQVDAQRVAEPLDAVRVVLRARLRCGTGVRLCESPQAQGVGGGRRRRRRRRDGSRRQRPTPLMPSPPSRSRRRRRRRRRSRMAHSSRRARAASRCAASGWGGPRSWWWWCQRGSRGRVLQLWRIPTGPI